MRKRMTDYMSYIEKAVSEQMTPQERETVKRDFLIQIQFFQNERHIHLMVTLAFALMTIGTVMFNFYAKNIVVGILSLGLTGMLVPYLNHYFFLERGVQKMYTYYDALIKQEGLDWRK
ncbi:MAG: hypothetical protein ACI4DS_02020 [Eubacterium sp.]